VPSRTERQCATSSFVSTASHFTSMFAYPSRRRFQGVFTLSKNRAGLV
jgi:hypothetical protein